MSDFNKVILWREMKLYWEPFVFLFFCLESGRDCIGQGQDQTEDGSRFRLVFRIAGLVVLGGLIIYMVPVLWRDFRMFGQGRLIEFFLRCLIFVFTIYIFGSGVRILLQRRNKENSGK